MSDVYISMQEMDAILCEPCNFYSSASVPKSLQKQSQNNFGPFNQCSYNAFQNTVIPEPERCRHMYYLAKVHAHFSIIYHVTVPVCDQANLPRDRARARMVHD